MSIDLACPSLLQLPDWGVIRVRGADTRSFLQGQLTQDVATLAPGQSALAGYCSAKGRLLATFVIVPLTDDDWLLLCSADLLVDTVKRLSMFVLRAKCKVQADDAGLRLFGLAGGFAPLVALRPWQLATGDADARVLRLPDALVDGRPIARGMLVAGPDALLPSGGPLDLSTWLALEAASGVPRVVAATREQFVPQMLNLELVGGVSFKKGCYPGQEIVARSQYRGTLKRRAYGLVGAAPMLPGQEIFHSEDPAQPAGMVALAGETGVGHSRALAELKISATRGGSLHLGAVNGPPLMLAPLPYAVPSESADTA